MTTKIILPKTTITGSSISINTCIMSFLLKKNANYKNSKKFKIILKENE